MTKSSLPTFANVQAAPPFPPPSLSGSVATVSPTSNSSTGLQAPMPGQRRA
jgi:hypothetical protein